MRPHRCRGDAGQVGGIEVLPFGFLVFVTATLFLANVWSVVDARLAVSSAAREAVRAMAEADDADLARAEGTRRAEETLRAHGRDDSRATVTSVSATAFGRCARVTVEVSYEIPAITIPFVAGLGSTAVRATSTAVIDPFRNGLEGAAAC